LPVTSPNTAYTLRAIALALRDIASFVATSYMLETLGEMVSLSKTKPFEDIR